MDQAQQLRNIIKQQNMQQHLARVITVSLLSKRKLRWK